MPRKEPKRTCVGCRTEREKQDLRRIVRTPGGDVCLDPGGRLPGRGVYVCPDAGCLDRALRSRALERGLKSRVPPEIVEALREALNED